MNNYKYISNKNYFNYDFDKIKNRLSLEFKGNSIKDMNSVMKIQRNGYCIYMNSILNINIIGSDVLNICELKEDIDSLERIIKKDVVGFKFKKC